MWCREGGHRRTPLTGEHRSGSRVGAQSRPRAELQVNSLA
ncbi:hypothetical protein NSERUTF1_7741 [Nocardia seriolae]|nr:hypothetical protein NSERUTF1_7741 [Nocardia seriolae]